MAEEGEGGFRQRDGEILFIDARQMGALIPGSRKQKQLSVEELNQIAAVYQAFRRDGQLKDVAGFCKVATIGDVQAHDYVLTPGAAEVENDDEPFEEKMGRLTARLEGQFAESAKLEKAIRGNLKWGLVYE